MIVGLQRHAAQRTPIANEGADRRYFEIGGVTIAVASDLPFTQQTFADKFRPFERSAPGRDTISLHHHFGLPELGDCQLGREVYRRPPWVIYRREGSWIYLMVAPSPEGPSLRCMAVFDESYRQGDVYHASTDSYVRGGVNSLTLFPTDQILLAQVFAQRRACIMHSAAAILEGRGLLFVGHSEAGKSTTVKMLETRAEILCDDRNVVRRWPEEFRVHGTWSHGEVAQVSGTAAPLRAVLFLEKSGENRLVPLSDRKAIVSRLLACLIKPLVTTAWWEKSLDLIGALVREVPCYEMRFDTSGRIVRELEMLVQSTAGVSAEDAA